MKIIKFLHLFSIIVSLQIIVFSCSKDEDKDASIVSGSVGGHGYVDLGLSVKWATCNMGATKSTEYGDYYSWGYTEKWADGAYLRIDRTGEEQRYLLPEFDAATANWGDDWRMPTNDEFLELMNKCKWTWSGNYKGTGVSGYEVVANNGNSIFLPAAGCSQGKQGEKGFYWDSFVLGNSKSTLSTECLEMDDFKKIKSMLSPAIGMSIRPVVNDKKDNSVDKSGSVQSHDYVDLGLSVKWATCNVGAKTPGEYGEFYAWGIHTPWTEKTYSRYFYWIDYCGDDEYLDKQFDAASVNWGKAWRMPTEKEFFELRQNCIWRWTDNYKNTGVVGYIGKSKKNGNTIFLPAAGKMTDDGFNFPRGKGYYWSSFVIGDPTKALTAHGMMFVEGTRDDNFDARFYGLSVRPVLDDETNTEFFAKDEILNLDFENIPLEDANETAKQGIVVNGTIDGHTYVDLGLPSKTLWATYNVGGSSTDSKGNYYAWGETETKDYFEEKNYKFFVGYDDLTNRSVFTKYVAHRQYGNVDDKIVLEPEDDAATQNWGNNWRMPTQKEMTELVNACVWKTATVNGVSGWVGTSLINRNKIFFPAMGFKYMNVPPDFIEWYWTSSLSSNQKTGTSLRAFALTLSDTRKEVTDFGRHQGLPIRAVVKK
ncbi:MAG: hypothetical protein MJZ24_07120 [Paludibacteraceae bacterium]|nr:hypothetical protein [Paludibacteraceae bacterium]